MELIDAEQVSARTPWSALIDAIGAELAADRTVAPARHHHSFRAADGTDGSLLLMPSWSDGDLVVVKAVTYVGSNAGRGRPTVNAGVLALDGADGRILAAIDGDELTVRRTAAVSALASRYLSRPESARLLVVGTGELAPRVAAAHAAVRPIGSVSVWGRRPARAAEVASGLRSDGIDARPVTDLEAAAADADIVSCVTGATEPVVHGAWLRPGTHLDLVGSFGPEMRESDDGAIGRSSIFVDTRAGALRSGDLAQPIEEGLLDADEIRAELGGLVSGAHPGRTAHDEVTLFKSAGSALADLAATRLVLAAVDV